MIDDAIRAYHDIISSGQTAANTHEALMAALAKRNLCFGSRPICSVLRPRFLTSFQSEYLQSRTSILSRAFRKMHDRAMRDRPFLKQFGVHDWEEELFAHEPGYDSPNPIARFDGFFSREGRLRFVELNSQSPAGAGYTDALAVVFAELPAFQEFQQLYTARPLPCLGELTVALLDCYRQWSGNGEPPRIAIVDWANVPTQAEFVLFAEALQAQGFETCIADPRELDYYNGTLRANGRRVNLVYRRILLRDLIDECGLNHPLIRAVREGAACMVNPFRCKVLGKKAAFAVATDDRNAAMFTAEEREAIREHIPWTRIVADRITTHDGLHVDLLPYIVDNKDRLVLKPNNAHGGKQIVLGWNTDTATWTKCLSIAQSEGYVVQERVDVATEPYPSFDTGRLNIHERWVDTNPFVANGHAFGGCLTRLSTEPLVNVLTGGGVVPTFVVAKRV